MVINENVNAFIEYNFIPFNKGQCIKRLVCIWLLSAVLCFIGKQFDLWIVSFGVINILVSILFITLIAKHSSEKISRYLCDGIFYLYLAIILNIASYRVFTLIIEPNWFLLLIFLILLAVCILIFGLVTLSNIKNNKFSAINNGKKMICFPLLGSACGILATRLFLQGQSQQVALTIVAFILLILSFMISIPSLNLLKAMLYKKQKDN